MRKNVSSVCSMNSYILFFLCSSVCIGDGVVVMVLVCMVFICCLVLLVFF